MRILTIFALCFAAIATAQSPANHPRAAEAERAAAAWLDLFTAGEAEQCFAQLTDVFKANLTEDAWRGVVEKSARDLGFLKSRSLARVVIYENPANAPLPGIYVAVEYDSVYQNASKHFQYIMLHSQDGEPFKVMRHESTVLRDGPGEGAVAR